MVTNAQPTWNSLISIHESVISPPYEAQPARGLGDWLHHQNDTASLGLLLIYRKGRPLQKVAIRLLRSWLPGSIKVRHSLAIPVYSMYIDDV